jgi:DNA-binding IclR family transcriptional regulator
LFVISIIICYFKLLKAKEPANSITSSRERYRIPILDRALDLMELLSTAPDGLTLTEMTESLAMPKNTVFRIATSLTLRGYCEREERTKRFRLSRKFLKLGHLAIGGEGLIRAAGPVLTALRDATGETALLGTLSGSNGIVLDQVASSHPVKVVVEIGHAFPLLTAAPAKAILAFLPPVKREELLREIVYKRRTRHTITSARAYGKELEEVQRLGFAMDRGEESETYLCAAAPVMGFRGEPVAAIWISGPSDRISIASLPKLGRMVKSKAQELSAILGYLPETRE